ncbi:MAG: hypothetical protein KDA57_08510 [Planctomycetales bacterium]|nr:hypothetical protein [Planctomycetales bacterium]
MTTSNLMQRTGATPAKLALVAVLAIVLVTVIVVQLPENQPALEPAQAHSTASANQPNQQINGKPIQEKPNQELSKDPDTKRPTGPREWPELSIDGAIAFDPLAAPEWLVAAMEANDDSGVRNRFVSEVQRQARNAEVLAQLREQGTSIVVITNTGEKRATIGEQSLRIGDQIEGFQITDITKQGVVLSEVDTR